MKTKKMFKKTKIIIAFIILVMGGSSCTDLKETVYSELSADNFYQTEQQMVQAMGSAYANMRHGGVQNLWGHFGLNTVASDEAVIPFREGNLWRDGGTWERIHQHNVATYEDALDPTWINIFSGVTSTNSIIKQIEDSPLELESKPKMLAELKVLRAYYLFMGMDMFGNIPMPLDFAEVELPEQRTRAEAFVIIEKELKDNIGLLDDHATLANYGRVTKSVAHTILAKMYIMADEWLGTPHWDDVITQTDAIIDMNHYILESNYLDNFSVSNEGSRENIFVVPFDIAATAGYDNGFLMYHVTLAGASAQTFDFSAFCWNGVAATEEHYNLYDVADARIDSWLEGPQLSSSGEDLGINYTPFVGNLYSTTEPAGAGDGVRFAKYAYEPGLSEGGSMSNDWVIYRYADVLLLKAEALMRKSGGTADGVALALVNQVRERAFGDALHNYASLDLPELLNERSRELAWEGHRRQDQIRFGTWGDAWKDKPASDETRKLFPIPLSAISTNNKLLQNTGY